MVCLWIRAMLKLKVSNSTLIVQPVLRAETRRCLRPQPAIQTAADQAASVSVIQIQAFRVRN